MKLETRHLWLALFTNADAASRQLDRIYINDGFAVVTDGHRLVRVPCDDTSGADPLSLPIALAKAALKGSQKDDVWSVNQDHTWLKRERDGVSWPIDQSEYEHSAYPDISKVLPLQQSDDVPMAVFVVNVDFISDIATYLKKTRADNRIRIQASTPLEAVHITVKELDGVLFVVMPTT